MKISRAIFRQEAACHNSLGAVRSARPQPFLHTERTGSTGARENGENAAGGFFQQTLK